MVGTHKGGFLFFSDEDRKSWEILGPFHRGLDVNHMSMDTRADPTIWACVNSSWFGSGLRFSRDFGKTWEKPEQELAFAEDGEHKLEKLWFVEPGRVDEPDTLYAGVAPAALFKSEDGGQTWSDVPGLTNHPTREKWQPGMGGMMVHSLWLHPNDLDRLWVAISAAGVFYTEDGGATWEPRNRNVRADFLPDKKPDVGQCVHHMAGHPAKPDVLYQQNHCGMYRSDDAGLNWIDVGEDLPSDFGFPIQVHPHQPDTIYVIPEQGGDFR
ncbi:MAG: exo-alpha-sialidase, partial [Verrucomicrobiota bacterium]